MKSNVPIIRSNQMAEELQDLLDIPWEVDPNPKSKGRKIPNTGRRVFQAILQVIIGALQRGETVLIKNFGTFKVVTRKPVKYGHGIVACSSDLKHIAYSAEVQESKPRKVVKFIPSRQLLALVNQAEGCVLGEKYKGVMSKWR